MSASGVSVFRVELIVTKKGRSCRTAFLDNHGKLLLCSRRDSNSYRWYRKPEFYPLNYGNISANIVKPPLDDKEFKH